MDYTSIYGLNLRYCCQWISRLDISNLWWINSSFNEPDLLYGSDKIWVVTILIHNGLQSFFAFLSVIHGIVKLVEKFTLLITCYSLVLFMYTLCQ